MKMTKKQITFEPILISTIREAIETTDHILIVSHIRPDGDAVGSLLGMGLALLDTGKDVQMVLPEEVPINLRHLQGSNQIRLRAERPVELIIVLDVSDLKRLGNVLEGYGKPDINIDHHYTNESYARWNLVDRSAVATSEIIARHISTFGLQMSSSVANALLTGIITDTIGFRTKNVTTTTLRIVADLTEAGGSLSEMYYLALVQRTLDGVRYWGAGLSKIKQHDRLIWTYLSLEDRHNAGYLGNDDADLINVMSAIDGADVAMIVVEQSPSRVKISWRLCSNPLHQVDVSQIAIKFGGGGHKEAAGAEVSGSLMDVLQKSVEFTQDYMTLGCYL